MDYEYHDLKINRFDVSSANLLQIWMNICKMNAYIRLYTILNKKKFNLKNILFSLSILFLSIPVKIISLFYDFIKNKYNFREWLEMKEGNLYWKCESLNIEIIDNKIYLNCFTLVKFIREIRNLKPDISKQEMFNVIYDTKLLIKNLNEAYNSSEMIKMTMGKIKNNEQMITNTPHYTHLDYISSKKYEIWNSIHQTSNTNVQLIYGQRIDASIPLLTKASALKPGTIISQNIIFIGSNKYIWVPKYQISVLMANNLDIFEISNIGLILKHNECIREIFLKNANIEITKNLSQSIHMGNYNMHLIDVSNNDMIKAIEDSFQ